jgi:hydrogenase expression/formation protein HypC
MQVISFQGNYALCQRDNETQLIDIQLIHKPAIGDWLLVFIDAAREIISAEQAYHIKNALHALTLSLQGEQNIDYLFADLINREPELPEYLRAMQ